MYVFGPPIPEPSPSTALPNVGPDDRAYIVYSSGTTGKPKGFFFPICFLFFVFITINYTTVPAKQLVNVNNEDCMNHLDRE